MASFLYNACLPFLLRAQNPDGSWGYRPASPSRVEPTSWALLALAECSDAEGVARALDAGQRWLLARQSGDGSWPAGPPGDSASGWPTSLACIFLLKQRGASEPLRRGLHWLSNAWPGDSGWGWRLRRWVSGLGRQFPLGQDPSLCGWSWNAGTASWVEPTSYALLALRNAPQDLLSDVAVRRSELGERFLLDRVCDAGGWNCGNPSVYGVPGQPQVLQTAWALLALRQNKKGAEISRSLNWLEQALPALKAPASLAAGQLCLAAWGIQLPSLEARLERSFERNRFLDNVVVAAWAALALVPAPMWLKARREEGEA